MSNPSPNAETAPLPRELIAERQSGWKEFTRATFITCLSVATVLVLLLLVFRVF
jgi:hypothetical protein